MASTCADIYSRGVQAASIHLPAQDGGVVVSILDVLNNIEALQGSKNACDWHEPLHGHNDVMSFHNGPDSVFFRVDIRDRARTHGKQVVLGTRLAGISHGLRLVSYFQLIDTEGLELIAGNLIEFETRYGGEQSPGRAGSGIANLSPIWPRAAWGPLLTSLFKLITRNFLISALR